MKTIEILKAARALIEDPARWTQGAWARDARGKRCDPTSPDAVCWCAAGALWRAERDAGGPPSSAAWLAERAARRTRGLPLTEANDGRGHAMVMAVFDRAIIEAGG